MFQQSELPVAKRQSLADADVVTHATCGTLDGSLKLMDVGQSCFLLDVPIRGGDRQRTAHSALARLHVWTTFGDTSTFNTPSNIADTSPATIGNTSFSSPRRRFVTNNPFTNIIGILDGQILVQTTGNR